MPGIAKRSQKTEAALAALFTVNTMPEGTLKALADHGDVSEIMSAEAAIAKLFWISLLGLVSTSTTWPQSFRAEGAKSFVSSWSDFMSVIASKSATVGKAA